jgi:23S rRNA (cytidine1920-2'-O)/16S rRNA (cytidine1409-2'-O)-methyltransferase
MAKKRMDTLMVEKNLAPSREKAKRMILAGEVFIKSNRVDKPGTTVDEESEIMVKSRSNAFVSRGGFKLDKALDTVEININDATFLDVGASTGGFTDCLLKRGAKKVFAIDVGYGQLAWEIRNDPRVVPMERTNIRYVTPEDIGEACDGAVIDVSFISLTKVLPAVIDLLKQDAKIITLIKPQFEAGKGNVGKNGVVRDKKTHVTVVSTVLEACTAIGLSLEYLDYSPIKGPKGNIEFLACFTKNKKVNDVNQQDIEMVIDRAHNELINNTANN